MEKNSPTLKNLLVVEGGISGHIAPNSRFPLRLTICIEVDGHIIPQTGALDEKTFRPMKKSHTKTLIWRQMAIQGTFLPQNQDFLVKPNICIQVKGHIIAQNDTLDKTKILRCNFFIYRKQWFWEKVPILSVFSPQNQYFWRA